MANPVPPSSPVPPASAPLKRRVSWPKRLLFLALGLLVLLVIGYFVVTSEGFFKGVILPRASAIIGGKITVDTAQISPFSHVDLRGLKILTTGTEPILRADEVRLRYSLTSIIGGTIKVDEISVVSPVVQIYVNPDGTSNADPLSKGETNTAVKPSTQPAPSKPLQIDLRNLSVKDASVHYTKTFPDGTRQTSDLTGINVSLDQLRNGQSGKFTADASLKTVGPTNDLLEAKSTVDVEFTLGPDLLPSVLKAKVDETVLNATGAMQPLAGFRSSLTSDVTPTEVKEIAERFYRNDQLLGQIKLSGPLDLEKREGHLKLEADSIDHNLLNLLGAPRGIDFASTALGANLDLVLAKGGALITAKAMLSATNLSISEKGQTTPALDLAFGADVTIHTDEKTMLVSALTVDGHQGQQQIMSGGLTQPMTIAWGTAASQAGDSEFHLTVSDFNLAQWQLLTGGSPAAGTLSTDLKLASQQAGKSLNLSLNSKIDGLDTRVAGRDFPNAALSVKLDTQVTDLKKVSVSDYRVALTQSDQPALTVSGTADYDGSRVLAQTQIEAYLSRLLGNGPSQPLALGVKLDGAMTGQIFDLRQLQFSLPPTDHAASNELNLTGRFDLSTPGMTKGTLTAKADVLDVTPLYQVFASMTNRSEPAQTPAEPGATGNAEPEAENLPLQFTADADIAQAWLGEINAQGCRVTAKVDGGKVTLDPCKMTVNGGPVSATINLDLAKKGFAYALDLCVDKVPLEPVANTFAPANKGNYQGTILASAKINGAGITGVNLHKNLAGAASFSFTNAHIQLSGPKMKRIVTPIARLLGLNELISDPVRWVDAKIDLGNGNIGLTRCMLESPAFEASVQGAIPIADVLSNSPLNLPVQLFLERSLAQKTGLLAANTPADATYAPIKNFVTIKGTIGQPTSDLDRVALGGLLFKSGQGMAERLGGKTAGSAISGLSGLLNGGKSDTNANGTNAPKKKLNPFDLFKRN